MHGPESTKPKGKLTERSFYPRLIDLIRSSGGQAVSEIQYNGEPDIVFEAAERRWLLGVKIGETPPILKRAFIQYQRHKDETKLNHGLLLFLPESVRSIEATQSEIATAIASAECTCLIDTPVVKDEVRNITFPALLARLNQEVVPAIARAEKRPFPLGVVLSLLQQHVMDMMQQIHMSDADAFRVITDKKLLSGIGHLSDREVADASRFLASYILLSQVLFLRLFSRTRPNLLPPLDNRNIKDWLEEAFRRILDINYKPIFELAVLPFIPEEYATDTFHLIWGLEVEGVRYELPGRLFHELMPAATRKMLAAFYTRPEAADLLARLCIAQSRSIVFDPACGSGTILVSAYRRKSELFNEEGRRGNPHSAFCEQELMGSDIMPFAVHLSTANLASMDPSETITKALIIEGDSLRLSKGVTYNSGVQTRLFQTERKGYTMRGARHDVDLEGVQVVLMNPPFTKMERGIRHFVNLDRFDSVAGKEVGLWGHFVPLASEFLDDGGMLGAVLPINVLRGRESAKIRELLFSRFTPLVIVKTAINYGFSEWAEYRDILFVARKGAPPPGHKVKLALVKKDFTKITRADLADIDMKLSTNESLRSDLLDVDSQSLDSLRTRFDNMMWFLGVSDFRRRDKLAPFVDRFAAVLDRPPARYFREGYMPRPTGASSFMFLTNHSEDSRIEEAFLSFEPGQLNRKVVTATSKLGTEFRVESSSLVPSLRTGVGLTTLDVTKSLDLIASVPYAELDGVRRASGFRPPKLFSWKKFWDGIENELTVTRTRVVTLNRINPYSPSTGLVAFYSSKEFSPANTLNVVQETDEVRAKAFCTVMNSVAFWTQFFLLKEETTGRHIHIRFYDLHEMNVLPRKEDTRKLARIFDDFSAVRFPSLRDQFDSDFEARYKGFWLRKRKQQTTLVSMADEVTPHPTRLAFDKAVCEAIGVKATDVELKRVYQAIVEEMIVTRGLIRD